MAIQVMKQITDCLDSKKNFLLSGGAGSGKTYTLIQTLNHVFNTNSTARVACITYTNVASDEIKERSPFSNLFVSTIHDFLWEEIKDYQKNLKESVINLLRNGTIKYSGDTDVNDLVFDNIQYKNYRKIEIGIISHDDLLKIANYMFAQYPLLAKILCDKFDFIFIDEYQDTQELVVEIFLSHISNVSRNNLCIGFFGDKMQCIYETGVGNIQNYVDSGYVQEIIKDDNFRCSISVINLLNRIRSDIEQKPAKLHEDGSIANKQGSALFLYSRSEKEFNLNMINKSEYVA
ncbi:ATP-dependent helicase, partial [Listeria monocytogenes]|nr:ATP-dependent helicase [Listeria monocytogenes]